MKTTSNKKKFPAKKEFKENIFPVVAIGASAGGLEAMDNFNKRLYNLLCLIKSTFAEELTHLQF